MNDRCWLPEVLYFENYKIVDDYEASWKSYENALYDIFKRDFIDGHPAFENKRVNIRKEPMEFGKEEAFFHITCQDYRKDGNRVPDFKRCERIKWVRAFIENYNCDSTQCDNCDGVKVWDEPYKNTTRVFILLEEERYIVILERRENYCLLITAYYIEWDHTLQKRLQSYKKYNAK